MADERGKSIGKIILFAGLAGLAAIAASILAGEVWKEMSKPPKETA